MNQLKHQVKFVGIPKNLRRTYVNIISVTVIPISDDLEREQSENMSPCENKLLKLHCEKEWMKSDDQQKNTTRNLRKILNEDEHQRKNYSEY